MKYLSLAVMSAALLAVSTVYAADDNATTNPWDAIEARAKAAPAGTYSPDRALVEKRPMLIEYYKKYASWQPPVYTPPAGKLTGLTEKPAAPRFELTDKMWPAKPGDASVCLWEDDKTAAYSFSTDDNNAGDFQFWTETSKKYGGLNITFNLITINIGGEFDRGRVSSAGTWDLWQKAIDSGFHIASHTVTHVGNPVASDGWPGPVWEAVESFKAIDSHLTTRKTKVFVYPGSSVKEFNGSAKWRAEIAKYVPAARGGSGVPINIANQTDYYDIRTTAAPADWQEGPDKKQSVFDITNILTPNPDKNLKKYYRGWATTFIHFVNGGKGWGETPVSKKYIAIFDWVAKNRGEIWIGHLDDVALYGQERDTSKLTAVSATDQKIVLSLTCQMDPTIFDYPLTIKVRLPDAWKNNAKATQAGKELAGSVIMHDGAAYLLVKAVPSDHDNIELAPN